MMEEGMDQASAMPSVNRLAAPLAAKLVADAVPLRLKVTRDASGATIVDAGIATPGGIEAGRRIAEICLGGLGEVAIASSGSAWPWTVGVHTQQPVLACLGSQYAGWSLQHEGGGARFFALGSGPARSLVATEELFKDLAYRDRHDETVLVLEVDRSPPTPLLQRIAEECGVAPERLTVVLTPTKSLA